MLPVCKEFFFSFKIFLFVLAFKSLAMICLGVNYFVFIPLRFLSFLDRSWEKARVSWQFSLLVAWNPIRYYSGLKLPNLGAWPEIRICEHKPSFIFSQTTYLGVVFIKNYSAINCSFKTIRESCWWKGFRFTTWLV